jgi:hypothetical protein
MYAIAITSAASDDAGPKAFIAVIRAIKRLHITVP